MRVELVVKENSNSADYAATSIVVFTVALELMRKFRELFENTWKNSSERLSSSGN